MDGAPVKGESIPIRVFLAGYDLTPTMRVINKKFSVRYFLNLVLIDTEDRRYFKQQEITLWRKSEKTRKSLSNSAIGSSSAQGSTNNLTQAQQNAQMPTHLVQGASSIIHNNILTSSSSEQQGDNVAVGNSSPNPLNTDQSNMGLFTEEESPQHEALGSKIRSNPLAFDTELIRKNVTHVYSKEGSYTATLTVTDAAGTKELISHVVDVYPANAN